MRTYFLVISFLLLSIILMSGYFWMPALFGLLVWAPCFLVGLIDMTQKSQAIRRNFPLIEHLGYLLEEIRPEI